MLNNNPKVSLDDQYTDRSGAALVKISSRLKNSGLAKLAIDTLFKIPREGKMQKTASFPTDSASDTFLSRLYFEGQREKIASDKAAEINANLEKYEALYGINNRVVFADLTKQAADDANVIELLPMCKIASEEELIQSGKDFSEQYEKLASKDRRTFALNFIKAASGQFPDVEIPEQVRLYAEVGVEGRGDIADSILLRKVAMERQGKDTVGYDTLYSDLSGLDTAALPVSDLHKLAEYLDKADNLVGLRETKHGKTIPDAWHTVFQIKQAEAADMTTKLDVDSLTKADIIARYGEGILDEVENDDGSIDKERLKEIIEVVEPDPAPVESTKDADTGKDSSNA